MSQARNTNIDTGNEKQLKLQMSLNNYHQQDADQLAHVGNPSAVSTGLRLSYEDDEHNSSITSGSGSMSSLPTTLPLLDDLMAEIDKENEEISYYLRLQVKFNANLSIDQIPRSSVLWDSKDEINQVGLVYQKIIKRPFHHGNTGLAIPC